MSKENMETRVPTHEGVSTVLGERVGSCKRQVIGVIGIPGAWTNQVGKALVRAGVLIIWPDQSLDMEGDRYLYDSNCENPEINRMHEQVFKSCNETRYSGRVPRFFDSPFPGPEQFIAKFPEGKREDLRKMMIGAVAEHGRVLDI